MTAELTQEKIDDINKMDSEARFRYCIKEITTNRQVWILKDEHGCVMLNTDDEDGVPVWPNRQFAEQWATGDWKECVAESISLAKWQSRWTMGLEDDELAVVVFPNLNEEGVVLYPDEFDFELRKKS